MRHDLTVSKSVVVNATPPKVWQALTDPEIIKEYLFGTETVTNWQPGSSVIFQGAYDGHTYRDKGVVLENIPNEKLKYSYWSGFTGLEDKPENYSIVTYTVVPKDHGQTEFTWTQQGFADEGRYMHSKEGMEAFMEGIKRIMER